MKKLLLYLPIFFLALWSCDQMEDVYDDLDENTVVPYFENIEYTFTAEDYKLASKAALAVATNASDSALATSIEKDMAFNQTYTAADFVAAVLAVDFPALNLNSTALVTYNEETGTPEGHLPYLNAGDYELSVADYNSVGGLTGIKGYFIPSATPEENIPAILNSNIASPAGGDVVFVTYKYYGIEPTDSLSSFELYGEDFDAYANYDTIDLAGWSHVEEAGTRAWLAREYSGNSYAQFSSYGSGEENIAWLITPEIDLSAGINNKLSFDVNVGYYTHEGLEVLISEDYDGSNLATATWDNVSSNFTFPTEPTGGYGNFATAGTMSLSSYSGNVHIAFVYTGDGANSQTTTYQIDNVTIISGVADLSDEYNVYYEYSGTEWFVSEGILAINPIDYDAMGAPGKYNNFSSSDAPENYIPQFLAIQYPFAQDGDVITVSYKYYSGGTITLLDDYKYESGMWAPISTVVESTNQFVYGLNGWAFDPTVSITMISADYRMITDYVLASNPEYGYTDGSAEFYYGSASKYANFDLRVSKRNIDADGDKPAINIPGFEDLSDDEAIDLIWSRIPEAISTFLTLKYPDAVTSVNSIDVYYIVWFTAYENDLSTNYYSIKYKCTKDGPNPEFTQDDAYGEEDDTVYGKYNIRKAE